MSQRQFETPTVHLNYDGWGPTTLPAQFVDVPYAPFGKGDRLGKAADFTSGHSYGRYKSKYLATCSIDWVLTDGAMILLHPSPATAYQRRGAEQDVNVELQYRFDTAEDLAFQLVDTSKPHKPRIVGRKPWQQRGRKDQFQGRNRRLQQATLGNKRGQQQSKYDKLRKGRYGGRRRDDRKVDRAASVKVQADWKVIDQFELPQLLKLQANDPDVEDM